MAQEGATPFELKAHGGHKDIKSVERYAHLDKQLTRRTAEKMRRKIYMEMAKWYIKCHFQKVSNPQSVGIASVAG